MDAIDRSDRAALLASIQELRPLIDEHRAETDRLRRLPDAVAAAFVEQNLFRMLLPKDYGGLEIDLRTHLSIVEEVSCYDGSVGWNLAIGSGTSLVLRHLPTELAREICAAPQTCFAGSLAPLGRAVRVDGGYRVSGHWDWASGIHQATWVVAGCFVFDGETRAKDDNGLPLMRQVLFPIGECDVLDAWHVGGMRGTGSTDFTTTDLFVPEVRSFLIFSSPINHPAPVFRLPSTFFGVSLACVCLGIARAAADALTDLASTKRSIVNRAGALQEQQGAQYDVARATALIESARLYLHEAAGEMWDSVCRGDEVSLLQRTRVRRAQVHAAESAATAVDIVYRAAGGTALFERKPFERCLRDVHAALGHITLQRSMMEDVGRVQFGLPPLSPLF